MNFFKNSIWKWKTKAEVKTKLWHCDKSLICTKINNWQQKKQKQKNPLQNKTYFILICFVVWSVSQKQSPDSFSSCVVFDWQVFVLRCQLFFSRCRRFPAQLSVTVLAWRGGISWREGQRESDLHIRLRDDEKTPLSLDPESVGVALVCFSWSACQMIEQHLKASSPHTSPTSPASDIFSNFLKATLSTFTPTSHRDRPDVWSWERWRCLIPPLSPEFFFPVFTQLLLPLLVWTAEYNTMSVFQQRPSKKRVAGVSSLARYLIF